MMGVHWAIFLCYFMCLKIFLKNFSLTQGYFSHWFLESGREEGVGEGGSERNIDMRETHQLVAFCTGPYWGCGICKQGTCPWPGTKPTTLRSMGLCSNHWGNWPGLKMFFIIRQKANKNCEIPFFTHRFLKMLKICFVGKGVGEWALL